MPRLWIFSDLHQDWADNAWDPSTRAPVLSHSHTAQLQLDGPHRSPTYSHGHCGRLFVPFAESWTSRCIFVPNFFNEIGIDLRKNYGPRHTRDECLVSVRRDYEDMKSMIFGTPPTFDEILASIEWVQEELNLGMVPAMHP